MQVKYLAGIVGAALLLAVCSSSNELTSAGQNVRFVQEKPGAECQLLGTATGKQSNWLSGQNGDEGGSMRGAANALRNQAAAMGGNWYMRGGIGLQDATVVKDNNGLEGFFQGLPLFIQHLFDALAQTAQQPFTLGRAQKTWKHIEDHQQGK